MYCVICVFVCVCGGGDKNKYKSELFIFLTKIQTKFWVEMAKKFSKLIDHFV